MKKIIKNSILQKTLISILVVMMLTNFILPNTVQADVGGVLFSPVQSLVLTLGDVAMWVANMCTGNTNDPILKIDGGLLTNPIVLVISTVMLPPGANLWPSLLYKMKRMELGQYPDKLEIPYFTVSIDKIFSNQIPLLDIDIINPREESAAYVLQSTIANWYATLRKFAIVGLLSVLVYMAIRIIISSTASDKAKYKQLLLDWIVAFCLLFFMHYIMSFSITMVKSITNAISKQNRAISLPISVDDLITKYNITDENTIKSLYYTSDEDGYVVTDLMGYVRFLAQTNKVYSGDEVITANGIKEQMGYTIMYIVLVVYTFMFLYQYIKRLVYIIFLTIISPLVAFTYPIDKMNDGKAQAFDMWIKEYVFNLLIQPVHLLLYYILVGSAIELATEYLLYPLVAIGFLLPAEKLLRKFFGFEKASTGQSIMGGALGGAMLMKGIDALGRFKGPNKGPKPKMEGGKSGSENSGEINYNRTNNIDDLIGGLGEGQRENSENNLPDGQDNNLDNQIMEAYSNDGFGQNANGEYYNPSIDEYDPDYNPTEDESYRNLFANETNETEGTQDEPLVEEQETTADLAEKPNIWNGAKSLAGKYVFNKENGVNVAKGVVRGVGKVYGAATLGTLGIAAGLASDDYANVAKYGIAAGAMGSKVGGNLAKGATDIPGRATNKFKEMQDVYRQNAYTKKQYEQMQNERIKKQFMKNKEMIEKYKKEFRGRPKINGEEAYKVAMRESFKYKDYGVKDEDSIIKAMKAKSLNGDIADSKRIVAAKISSQVSNEKDIENIQKRLIEKGVGTSSAKEQANAIREIKGLI